jgi:hypothetical protein
MRGICERGRTVGAAEFFWLHTVPVHRWYPYQSPDGEARGLAGVRSYFLRPSKPYLFFPALSIWVCFSNAVQRMVISEESTVIPVVAYCYD